MSDPIKKCYICTLIEKHQLWTGSIIKTKKKNHPLIHKNRFNGRI